MSPVSFCWVKRSSSGSRAPQPHIPRPVTVPLVVVKSGPSTNLGFGAQIHFFKVLLTAGAFVGSGQWRGQGSQPTCHDP